MDPVADGFAFPSSSQKKLRPGEMGSDGGMPEREDGLGNYFCRVGVLSMQDGRPLRLDEVRFLPEAAGKRKKLGQGLSRPFLAHFVP